MSEKETDKQREKEREGEGVATIINYLRTRPFPLKIYNLERE